MLNNLSSYKQQHVVFCQPVSYVLTHDPTGIKILDDGKISFEFDTIIELIVAIYCNLIIKIYIQL